MAVYQVQLILLTLTSAPKPPSNRYSYHRLPAWSISTTRSKQICNFVQCYSTFIDCMFKIFIFQLHELFRILYGMFIYIYNDYPQDPTMDIAWVDSACVMALLLLVLRRDSGATLKVVGPTSGSKWCG